MAEKPEKNTEEAIETPAVDDVTLAEAEVQTSDDAPADDAAALSATDEPEAAVAADDAEATVCESVESEADEIDVAEAS